VYSDVYTYIKSANAPSTVEVLGTTLPSPLTRDGKYNTKHTQLATPAPAIKLLLRRSCLVLPTERSCHSFTHAHIQQHFGAMDV